MSVGRAQAASLAMLGEWLSVQDSERIGLIWKCVPDEDLARDAQAIAGQLASQPNQGHAVTCTSMDAAQHQTLDRALHAETLQQRELGNAHVYAEGAKAFMAKRAPQFTDR